jgi:hypothetical protein
MKFVIGFLLAMVVILGTLQLLLGAAVTAEGLYISLSQASTAHQVTFAVIIGGTILGAIALVAFLSRPSDCYYGG